MNNYSEQIMAALIILFERRESYMNYTDLFGLQNKKNASYMQFSVVHQEKYNLFFYICTSLGSLCELFYLIKVKSCGTTDMSIAQILYKANQFPTFLSKIVGKA